MHRYRAVKSIITTGSIILLLGSCSGGGNSTYSSFDQNEMLQQIANNVILPSHQELSGQAQSLNNALQTLCANVNESNLIGAQNAWKNTQAALKTIEGYSFGPYKKSGFDAKIDFWPTRPDDIEITIANNPEFTQEGIEPLGATVRGMPALEYLLFNPKGNNALTLGSFSEGENASKRCAYLVALGQNLDISIEALYKSWNPEQGGYALSLAEAGRGSQDYLSLNSALNEMVNQLSNVIEQAKSTKLGKPLGYKNDGVAQADSVESPYSAFSLQDLIFNLKGIQNFYLGTYGDYSGLGLYHLIESKSPNAASEMDVAIHEALNAIQAIPEPLSQAVVAQPELVDAAYLKIRDLQNLIRGPIAGLLGVTISFSDSDGD